MAKIHFPAVFSGKAHAIKTFCQIYRLLSNWVDVWGKHRLSGSLPPLKFRQGFTLFHSKHDDPMMLMSEIFAKKTYKKHQQSGGLNCIVDIGANIGIVTLDLISQHPQAHIHSYEPNPSTFETLKRNVDENGFAPRVTLHQEAVGAARGTLEMWTNLPSDWATATRYSSAPPTYNTARSAEARKTSVPMVSLQEVLDRVPDAEIDLLKIDSEGAEGEILENISLAALRRVKYVTLEYHEHLCKNALERCRSILTKAGFACEHECFPNSVNGILYARRQNQ